MKWLLFLLLGISPTLLFTEGADGAMANGGSIVMEDTVVLLTDASDPNAVITSIKLYQGGVLKLSLSGCMANECRDDLSGLAPGSYDVDVTTDIGGFSGAVEVR